ncbi:MFS transporter [Streptomyces sp. NBC_01498]|uniref:MFS transporter n=1 Tax=Streptomyces sp. NBC_01498 TaxID=2975870 RepID=UPI002E7C19D7|nr:MFS transporter [Streptomyces sp. NBC_01498]WTL27638.1 MFS transporter [Streptomyces sp. NBC_01498]
MTAGDRRWLLRLVVAFAFSQAAVSMARPAVSYRALALGADERAIGVIAGVFALLPLFAAVPLGRRTDRGRCAPLLAVGAVLIAVGCGLSGTAGSLAALAAWSGLMGLGHLCFVIGAQSIVARRSAPAEQDRNFGHFTIGASLGQLVGPFAAGLLVSGHDAAMARTSALALVVSAGVAAVSLLCLRRIEPPARTGGTGGTEQAAGPGKVPVRRILRARGVPGGILVSLAVLSATDILTAYLPVVGEDRGISPTTIGLLLSLRAAAAIACRLVMTPMIRRVGRTALLTGSCLLGGLLCAGIALPVPVWGMALMLVAFGFCLGVGQPLSMTTVVRAAPPGARSTALALRLTGNRLGQVAAPASAGLVAGVAGTGAPFVMLGALLVGAAGLAVRIAPRDRVSPPAEPSPEMPTEPPAPAPSAAEPPAAPGNPAEPAARAPDITDARM